MIESVSQDLRYAARVLGRNRLFAAAAIGTLAVAIGANTAIFSLIDAAFLRPLPYPKSSRLVFLCEGQPSVTYSFSYPRYEMLRDQASAFEGIAAYDDESITASISGEPERIEGGRVSANFFSVLRVQPILGRTFTPDEDRAAGPPLVILSHHYWESHFNSDPNVVDRTLRIDGIAHSIIGVLPAGFQFLGEPVEVWRSRMADTGTFFPSSVRRGARYLTVIGRLKQGAGVNEGQASLAVADARYRHEYPGNEDLDVSVYATPLQQQLVSGSLRLNLFVAWGAVSCLLLIAAANIANLLLSRAAARRKEISVRLAIGASRWRIARQLLTESTLVALCGGALGLFLAQWGVKILAATIRQSSHQMPEARIDGTVAAFTLAVALFVGLIFGLAPVAAALRAELTDGLRSMKHIHLPSLLVTAEVALSLVLLAAAGLLMQSFLRMRGTATGIQSDQVSVLWLILNPHHYENFAARSAFYDETLRRVRALPGVRAAAIASRVDVLQRADMTIQGANEPLAGSNGRSISPDYLRLMGIPLLAGRDFNGHDATTSRKVMLVNQTFARRFFADRNPVGQRAVYGGNDCEVVGVVGDVRGHLQNAGANAGFYIPLAQGPRGTARLLVRSTAPLSAVRHEVEAVDPDQAIAEIRPLNDALDDTLSQPRSAMSILIAFASAALLLAVLGIYSVMAYGVAQRRREIAIRMALGAKTTDVRNLVLGQSLRLVVAGIAIGLPLAIATGRLYSALLFGVHPADLPTIASAIALVSLAALAAAYIPSRRATRVDPASALRAE